MLSPVRLSVQHTGGSVKTVAVRIVQFSRYYCPVHLVFAGLVSSRNSDGFSMSGAPNKGGVGKQAIFQIYASISRKRYEIHRKLLMTNRKLHMRFRLASSLMSLDDLKLLLVRIFSEFRAISQIWEATNNGYTNEKRAVLSAIKS